LIVRVLDRAKEIIVSAAICRMVPEKLSMFAKRGKRNGPRHFQGSQSVASVGGQGVSMDYENHIN